jgi:hypothetical protein
MPVTTPQDRKPKKAAAKKAAKTVDPKRYEIDGKRFIWHPDAAEDEPMADIVIPLRMKMKIVREVSDLDAEDITTMFAILEKIIPGQSEAIDELDVNDFVAMFTTWQNEYLSLNGASLGE